MTTLTLKNRTIVLASASPRRREILRALGLHFAVDPSKKPEPERGREEPVETYVVRVAKSKAQEVAARHSGGLIVGADTIVVLGRRILGKPASEREARKMLAQLSGRWHEVYSGICLIDNARGRSKSAGSRSRVHMRRISRAEIDWYISTREYRDKAGGYAIQGFASLFIDRIEGCYFNIVGFPVYTFAQLARSLGLRLFP